MSDPILMHDISTQQPWQNGPTELIAHAIEHLHQDTDFDQRVAFLLLDVGVETLFKTYLLLPERITKVKISFEQRKGGAEGGFHKLIEVIMQANPDLSKQIDLSRVEYFHNLRNKLYHDGNGITILARYPKDYAKQAVDSLKILLGVDLSNLLHIPEIEAEVRRKEADLEYQKELQHQKMMETIDKQDNLVQDLRLRVGRSLDLAIEFIAPKLLLPSFRKKCEELYLTNEINPDFFIGLIRNIQIDSISKGKIISRVEKSAIGISSFFIEDLTNLFLLIVDECISPGVSEDYESALSYKSDVLYIEPVDDGESGPIFFIQRMSLDEMIDWGKILESRLLQHLNNIENFQAREDSNKR
jgi:hypothetical protein